MIARFGQERDRMIEFMKQYNFQGLADERLWETIKGNFKFEQERIDEALEQKTRLSAALIADQLDCTKECAERLGRRTPVGNNQGKL